MHGVKIKQVFQNFQIMSLKVLVVGAGLTSSLIGSLLKQSQLACQVTLWDKARGAGGRMSTSRNPNDSSCTADLGAQYITAQPKYLESHNDFYNSLLMSKTIEPLSSRIEGMKDFPEGTKHFVAPNGINTVVKHFLKEGGHEVKYEHHVSNIDMNKDANWVVKTQKGHEEVFDVVVLTMPVPQILQISGDVAKLLDKNEVLTDGLKKVKYSSRYALGLFYDNCDSIPDSGWDAKYLTNHDTFRFVSIDSWKRHRADLPNAAVFHTSVDFGFKNIDKNVEDVKPILLNKVKELFPNWPQPTAVKCQKWRYSQVLDSHSGTPGCAVLQDNPLLVAAGDGFTHSNFDGCIESALAATQKISEFVTIKAL